MNKYVSTKQSAFKAKIKYYFEHTYFILVLLERFHRTMFYTFFLFCFAYLFFILFIYFIAFP